MLAEKFILLLETVLSRTYPDGSSRIVSTSRHVPIKLPGESGSRASGPEGWLVADLELPPGAAKLISATGIGLLPNPANQIGNGPQCHWRSQQDSNLQPTE
jgi:hypothetical protein